MQNSTQFNRVGVHDDPSGRSLLRSHLQEVAQTEGNVARSFKTDHGQFEVRDSLFAGPGGFLRLESTWQQTSDGLRLTTVIPYGGR